MDIPWGAGRVIAGRYRLVSQLGQGGMGSVWRADHITLSSPVAIKLIDPEIARRPEMLERFQREAQSSAALRSPHVVQIFDYGVDEGVPYIAMELLEGESLAARLARLHRLPYADTVRVVTHVGRALAKAHEAGVIHRDLKPDNVFLVKNDDKEIAKVLDFGIAKILGTGPGSAKGNSTRTGSILGTPSYMSPEQAQGTKTIDGRSDLWSLAVIAFECVCGQVPFQSEALGDLLIKICVHPIPLPSSMSPVPPGFDAWWTRASSRDPGLRFQTGKELADALRLVLAPESVAGQMSGPLSPAAGRLGTSNTVGAIPLHVSDLTPAGQYTPTPGGAYAPTPGGAYTPVPAGGYTPAPGGAYAPAPGGAYTPAPVGGYAPAPVGGYAPAPGSYPPPGGHGPPGFMPTPQPATSQPPDYRQSQPSGQHFSQPPGQPYAQHSAPSSITDQGAAINVAHPAEGSRLPIYALGAVVAMVLSGVGIWFVLGRSGPSNARTANVAAQNGVASATPLTVVAAPPEPVIAPAPTPPVSAAPVAVATSRPTSRPSTPTKVPPIVVVLPTLPPPPPPTPPPPPPTPPPKPDRVGF